MSEGLRGGALSQRILEQLADIRLKDNWSLTRPWEVPRSVASVIANLEQQIDDLSWRSTPGGILRDRAPDVWHAGHVSALLETRSALVVGTQTGGVWVIDMSPAAVSAGTNHARPLSDDWDTPDVTAMTFGPDGDHQVFVGCNKSAVLFLIDLQAQRTARLDLGSSTTVNAIVVQASARRIVLATDNGVKWAAIPARVELLGASAWRTAQGIPEVRFGGLALGAEDSVVAALWPAGPPPQPEGIFRGVWQNDLLVFKRAAIVGVETPKMFRTSLASCDGDRRVMYAVSAVNSSSDTANMSAVLRSADDGRTWLFRSLPPNAGSMGDYTNCIAVSPNDASIVVVGWTNGGPFFSVDGGGNWSHIDDVNDTTAITREQTAAGAMALHADLHVLHFARTSPGFDPSLYIGSDGGVARTTDLGKFFSARYAERLANLQFYGGPHGWLSNYDPPYLHASSRFPGLLSGGTQDNGSIYFYPEPNAAPAWRALQGGDGGLSRFVDALAALLFFTNAISAAKPDGLRIAFWDPVRREFGASALVTLEGEPQKPIVTSLEPVRAPRWRKDRQIMYACAGSKQGGVYGFFANPDGSQARLRKLGDVPFAVSATASYDGEFVYVAGTQTPRIVQIASANGSSVEHVVSQDVQGMIVRIEAIAPDDAYALCNTFPSGIKPGLLRFHWSRWNRANEWTRISDGSWTAFTVDAESGRLFAATDDGVSCSRDIGTTWTRASNGLPVRPHCTGLCIGGDGHGGRVLYLATYGRSVWSAQIALPPPRNVPDVPLTSDQVWRFVLEWFSTAAPGQPARDLLTAFVISELAAAMSAPNGSALQRAALQQIMQIAEREARRLD